MTAQFMDGFHFRDQDYALAGIHGQAPFEPAMLKLHPVSNCTACWRGYVACYEILDDQLVLARLEINLGTYQDREFLDAIGPAINGRAPTIPIGPHALFNNSYRDLALPLGFTGGFLIGHDFIDELYVHMGFHPAWKYREVWELIFDGGRLTSAEDVSDKVAELRRKLARKPLIPRLAQKDRLKWIQSTFRLDY